MANLLFKGLRELQVLVVHRPDGEGTGLVEHLRRIGCQVEAHWPPPPRIAPEVDVLLLAIDQELREPLQRLLRALPQPAPTLLAIVDYENPSTLQLVLESGALAVIGKPIRPFGLLTNLVLARNLWLQRAEADQRVQKLERRLQGLKKIAKAKSILMQSHQIGEEEAYRWIREQAMSKRTAMEEIAVAVIHAHELLHPRTKGD